MIFRELTRGKRGKRFAAAEPEVYSRGLVPRFAPGRKPGQSMAYCPLLDDTSDYVAFGGNGVRKGQGYRLATWLRKTHHANPFDFLAAASTLQRDLGLMFAAISPGGEWLALDRFRVLANSRPRDAARWQVRFYASASYTDAWCEILGWPSVETAVAATDPIEEMLDLMTRMRGTRKQLAEQLGIDPSTLTKILKRRRPYRRGLLEAVRLVANRSPEDVPLAYLPQQIVDAINSTGAAVGTALIDRASPLSNATLQTVATSTRKFLRGDFANGPDWNSRLFRAACDLRGRGIEREQALEALLRGAQPWDETELAAARRTIASAYSEQRVPSLK